MLAESVEPREKVDHERAGRKQLLEDQLRRFMQTLPIETADIISGNFEKLENALDEIIGD